MVLRDLDKEIKKDVKGHDRLKQIEIRQVLASLERVLLKKLIFGEEVIITRIGKFVQSKKQERRQHNVRTGKIEIIPKHYKILFKTTQTLNERMKAKTVF